MSPICAYALYTPAGRIRDWFDSPSTAPMPHPWHDYQTRYVWLERGYVGPMSASEEQQFFASAERSVRGYAACRPSAQALLRQEIVGDRLLDDLSDIAQVPPAD